MPTRQELIATDRSTEEICNEIGADYLVFQDLEALNHAVSKVSPVVKNFETSCFNGDYITGDVTSEYLRTIELQRNSGSPSLQSMSNTQLDLSLVVSD